MKISSFKRITKENLPEKHRELADSIGSSINDFASEIVNALNNNLSVTDNLNMQYKDIEVTLKTDGTPTVLTQYKSTLNTKTKGIQVIKAQNLTNLSTYPTGAPFITFDENNKIITIKHITGLVANNKYRITLKACGD